MSRITRQMRQLADKHIPQPSGAMKVTHRNGDTSDIIAEILKCYQRSHRQLVPFARACEKAGLLTTYNLWDFVKNEIHYRLDPVNWQWIKTPAAAWQTGFSDCKNKSIFTAAVLAACNVPFSFRFTSYSSEPIYTHVYIVVHHQGSTIPVDSVYHVFGAEKPYTYHKDYNVMNIAQIGALPEKRKATHGGKLSEPASGKMSFKAIPEGVDIFKLTDGELSAYLHLQKLKLKQGHTRAVKGVGTLADETLQDQIELTEDIIRNARDPQSLDIIADQAAEGAYNTAASIMGIGATAKPKKRQEKKEKREADKAKRKATGKSTGAATKPDGKPKGIKKVVTAVKKAAGAAIKAATALPRLVIREIIENELPKSAINFRYLFVNKPELINKLPDAARRKRKKQEEIFLFITKAVGMKTEHVMGILRNGILERTGKEPEQLLAAELGGQIAGIGLIDDAFDILIKIITKIAKAIGQKAPKLEKGDVADVATDFPSAGSAPAKMIAKEIEAQKPDTLAVEGATEEAGGSESSGGSARAPRKGFC